MNSTRKPKPKGYWLGKEGLKRAKDEILRLKVELNRTPKLKEVTVGIYKAITSGTWSEYGINTWLELLDYFQIESSSSARIKWKGEEGLKKAKEAYIRISKQINRRPTIKHVSGINKAIKREVWKELGIDDWEDFVEAVGSGESY